MNFLSPKVVTPDGTRYTSLTNDLAIPIGTLAQTRDGRRFRFGHLGPAASMTELAEPGRPLCGTPGTIGVQREVALVAVGSFQPGRTKYTVQVTDATPLPGSPYPANYFSTLRLGIPTRAAYFPCALAHHAAIPATAGAIFTVELAADDGVPGEAAGLNMTRGYLDASPYQNLRHSFGLTPVPAIAGFLVMPAQPGMYGWLQVGGPFLGIANVTVPILRGQALTIDNGAAFAPAAAGDQIVAVALENGQTPGDFPGYTLVDLRIG